MYLLIIIILRLTRLSDDDLTKAEDFIDIMKIMYVVTEAVSSEKVPTIGQIVPTLAKLEAHFRVNDGDNSFRTEIKNAVWANLSTRYQVIL